MIKAVIFDVDGVIFNTHDIDGKYLWSKNIKQDLGLSKEHFSKIFSSNWLEVIRGKKDTIKHLRMVFSEFSKLKITPEHFIEYWLKNDHNLNYNMIELIKSIKLPCYLATNQEMHRTTHILNSVGKHFDGCFASYQIGFIKPEKEFYAYIQNSLNLKPEELLIIDDTLENVERAKKCNWNIYHYNNDFDQLKRYLQNLRVCV